MFLKGTTCRLTAFAGMVLLGGSLLLAQQPQRSEGQNPERRSNQARQADRERDADQPNAAGRRQAQQGRQAGQGAAHSDAQLAACLIIDNQKEVALAQVAQEKAQNDQVKQFAEQMIQDHNQFIQQLQETAQAGGYSSEELAVQAGQARGQQQANRSQQQRDRQTTQSPERDPARQAARPAELDAGGRQGVNFISLKQEIAQECLQSFQQALSEKSGDEFDKAYISSQVMAHMAMQDMLNVFSRHASPELKPVLEKGLQTTKMHLEKAEQIKEQLAGGPQADQQQRQRQTN